jgi:hypothetical protein
VDVDHSCDICDVALELDGSRDQLGRLHVLWSRQSDVAIDGDARVGKSQARQRQSGGSRTGHELPTSRL